jgi:hypothetical protein
MQKKDLNQEKIPWVQKCVKVMRRNLKEKDIVKVLMDKDWPRIQFDELEAAKQLFRTKGR